MSEIVEFKPVSPVSVTLPDPSPATRLQVSLSARSIVSRDMFVRVLVSAQDKSQSGWFTVPPELGRIELKAGQELAIPVTVEIPAKTPFDKHAFKVLVADDANAQEEFSQSPLITVERKQAIVETKFWKKVAIGAAAAGVIAVVAILLFGRGTTLGKKCDPANPKCEGAVCLPELKRCVAIKGVACKDGEQCLSNRCEGGKCSPARLGDACFEGIGPCEGPQTLTCDLKEHRCVSLLGGPCKTPTDCLDGACTMVGSALACGNPIGQLNCADSAQCPKDQVCFDLAGTKVCLYRGGVLCPKLVSDGTGGRFTCASMVCNLHARCAPEDGSCVGNDADKNCDVGEQCVNGKCKTPEGRPPRRPMVNVEMLKSTVFMRLNEELTANAVTRVKRAGAVPLPP